MGLRHNDMCMQMKDTDDEHDEPMATQFHPGGEILMARSGTCHVQANSCIADSKLDAIVMKGKEDSPLRWDACTSSFKGRDAGDRYATIGIVPEPGIHGSLIAAHVQAAGCGDRRGRAW